LLLPRLTGAVILVIEDFLNILYDVPHKPNDAIAKGAIVDLTGCSKMVRSKAREVMGNEAYFSVRRNDA